MRGRFARFFPEPSWQGWVVVAAILFGLAYGLSTEEQDFARRLLKRKVLPGNPVTEIYMVVGRRGGKSRFVAWVAAFLAAFVDYRGVLGPGERGVGMLITPDRRQCRVLFRYVRAFFESDPMLAAMVESQTREAIHLKNGISIECHTASYRAVRGYTVVFAIVDEAAFLPTDDSAEPDTELLAAIRPAMATVPGALLMVISSPYARRGELWRAWKDHFGKDGDPIVVIQAPTSVMNPTVPQAVIDEAYERDPAAAGAEYGAEFRRDIEQLFSRELLDAAVMPGRTQNPYLASVTTYRAFVDPSGGSSDSMTLAIAHTEGEREVLDVLLERRPPFSPEDVTRDFAETIRAFGLSEVTGDRYAGEWPRERFAVHGVTYRVADRNRSELYRDLVPLMNAGRVELLDVPRLQAQLQGLERRTGWAGRDSIDHRPGEHDDLANAMAGALVSTQGTPGFLGFYREKANAAPKTEADLLPPRVASTEDAIERHQACRKKGRARAVADERGQLRCVTCGLALA